MSPDTKTRSTKTRSTEFMINPVLDRELRVRMRTKRAPAILTIYLLVLSAIAFLTFQALSSILDDPFNEASALAVAQIGRGIFEWLLFFMTMLVFFLVPGTTAGVIAGERERQTLVPLQVTLLKPRSILLGKIGAATAFIALLIVAALPLLTMAFLIGGVTVWRILASVLTLLAVALIIAALSAAISTFTKRTPTAVVLSYGLVLVLLAGTMVFVGALAIMDEVTGSEGLADAGRVVLHLNPLLVVTDVAESRPNFNTSAISPFDPLKLLIDPDLDAFDPGGADAGSDRRVPFWSTSLLSLVVLASGALVVATRRLTTPAASDR